MQRLNRTFFQRSADTVAKDMLGKYIIRKFANKKAILRIVETEAYMGADDKGSHSYEGKITERNKVMHEKGGVFYIYKIYGLYHCLNIVANKKGIPEAVFIRAAEPLAGIDILRKNRAIKHDNTKYIANGPGKLTQALKIGLDFNSCSVENSALYFTKGESAASSSIVAAARINIDYAQESKFLPLRFYIKGSKFLSNS